MLPVLCIPAAAFALRALARRAIAFADGCDARHLRKLEDSRRKMIKDLKESTRYEKTHLLISKYDPDAAAALAVAAEAANMAKEANRAGPAGKRQHAGPGAGGAASPAGRLFARATAATAQVAVSAALGAGQALAPVFDKMASAIGDNPALLENLRQVRGCHGRKHPKL